MTGTSPGSSSSSSVGPADSRYPLVAIAHGTPVEVRCDRLARARQRADLRRALGVRLGVQAPELAGLLVGHLATGLPQEGVREQAAAHPDLAVDPPDGQVDPGAVQGETPCQHVLVDAVDEGAVEVEQEPWARSTPPCYGRGAPRAGVGSLGGGSLLHSARELRSISRARPAPTGAGDAHPDQETTSCSIARPGRHLGALDEPARGHRPVRRGRWTPILEGLTLSLRAGDKTGVVGRNGAGKTSLLNVIAGDEPPLAGRAVRGRLGYLRQEPRGRETHTHSGLAHVLEARGLQEDGRAARSSASRWRSARASRTWRVSPGSRSGTGRPARARQARIAAGLGLPDDRLDLPVRALSGGERRRLELTRILFSGSDLLLLDEPTNHRQRRQALADFLAAYRGALVVVSHDLGLLDGAITRILHLDRDGVVQYRGTYSEYWAARRADEARLAAPGVASRGEAPEDARGLDAQADRQAREEGEGARQASAQRSGPWRRRAAKASCVSVVPRRAGAIVLEAEAP